MIAAAGKVGCDENKVLPEDPNEQIALAMENLGRALEAAGVTVHDVYKLGHQPAMTLVTVPPLASPQIKFEIEVYAAAAWEVQKAGFSCVVVEARDRVGGKTYSVDPLGDGGKLTWEKRGLMIQTRNFAEPNAAEAIRLSTREIEHSCHKLDIRDPIGTGEGLDKLTLLEWAKTKTSSKTALAVVKMWMRAMWRRAILHAVRRQAWSPISPLPCRLPVYLGLVNLLQPNSVVLNSPVFRISQFPWGVLVSSARGDFSCKRVIFSVQTIFYKSITFDPPLPSSKLKLAEHGVQSFSFKNIVFYSQPWWRKAGLSGALMSFKGPLFTSRDTSNDGKGHYSPTCFANGEFGRQLCKYPRAERTKAILTDIKRVFGPYTNVPDPIGVVQRTWNKDLCSRVCTVPVSPPGITTLHEHALRATHGKVHFVGTETAYEWKGYMYGAVISGERGAKEVIQALSEAKL
ncbi:hypothetical protein AnigIFM56816_009820 [Aspergillus niger]|nr:hypothetical protein AnigIFM56816_009820 [Aspergillus niger]